MDELVSRIFKRKAEKYTGRMTDALALILMQEAVEEARMAMITRGIKP